MSEGSDEYCVVEWKGYVYEDVPAAVSSLGTVEGEDHRPLGRKGCVFAVLGACSCNGYAKVRMHSSIPNKAKQC